MYEFFILKGEKEEKWVKKTNFEWNKKFLFDL